MKSFVFLVTGLLCFPVMALAQTTPIDAGSLASNNSGNLVAGVEPGDSPVTPAVAVIAAVAAPSPSATSANSSSSEPPVPQGRIGNQNGGGDDAQRKIGGDWEVFGGYTFTRFYEVSGTTENLNGYDFSLGFYPRSNWIGGEGEFSAAFGTVGGESSRLLTGMGGPVVRWTMDNGVCIWAHGLAGTTHFTPRRANSDQGAAGYEVGAGVDFGTYTGHWALRLEGDMVGTRFFGTAQYNPKLGAGIVFKF